MYKVKIYPNAEGRVVATPIMEFKADKFETLGGPGHDFTLFTKTDGKVVYVHRMGFIAEEI